MVNTNDPLIGIHKSTMEQVIEAILSAAKPIIGFISDVSGNGWIGFIVVFVIFFSIFLLRAGGFSRNNEGYTRGLIYIGARGLAVFAIYGAVLAFDFLMTPLLAMLASGVIGLLSGGHPNLFEQLALLFTTPGYRHEFGQFYGTGDRLLVPLGLRSTLMICVAFGTMYFVGRAMTKQPE